MLWAIFTVFIAAILFVALYFYLMRSIEGASETVTTFDENGNILSHKIVPAAKTERVRIGGLSHVSRYVSLAAASTAQSAIVQIFTLRGSGFVLYGENGLLTVREDFHLIPPSKAEREREQKMRRLFDELGIAPSEDYVHEYNGEPDASRDLMYSIGRDPQRAVEIVARLLREVYGVTKFDGLTFTFSEWNEEED